jgi:hypothetical protein
VESQFKEAARRTTEREPESRPRRRVESVLTRSNAGRTPLPEWVSATAHLESTVPRHLHPAITLEPLFPMHTTRAILSGALATPAETGPLDLTKLVDKVSRAEAIERIPHQVIPTLSRGVQVLIDRGEGMQPFAADQALLRSALVQVAGRDRTSVLYFEGSPLWGAGTGMKEDWPVYAAPAAGTPVVALTDLGIGQPGGIAQVARVSDWKRFAATLAWARCPLLALVPYPEPRWPTPLLRWMTIVSWDRGTTASVIRRFVGQGLRISKEI